MMPQMGTSYKDLLESSLNPKVEYAKEERMDNTLFAGWFCTAFSFFVPIFIFGSMYCGIRSIEKGFRKEGVLMMILSPIAILISVAIGYSIIAYQMNSSLEDFQRKMQEFEYEFKRAPSPQ